MKVRNSHTTKYVNKRPADYNSCMHITHNQVTHFPKSVLLIQQTQSVPAILNVLLSIKLQLSICV